jgi:integrase
MSEVLDPFNYKHRWETYKNDIKASSKENKILIKNYLEDMEIGINVNGVKGKRSPSRLTTLKIRMQRLDEMFNQYLGITNFLELEEKDLLKFFNNMEDGLILNNYGKPFKSTKDYIQTFKSFWNWVIKVGRKKGKIIKSITDDIKTDRTLKPDFVYFDIETLKRIINNSKYDYRVLFWFLFDSGIRTGKELVNVKVKDLNINKKDILELHIREESSKTFGRRIKLLLCKDQVLEFIKFNKLTPNNYLFSIKPNIVNKYLSRLSDKLKMKKITMYDFRHNSACYWLPKYKSESALKYRFGWQRSEMIQYYTHFLGMKDTITKDDLIDADERTELEKHNANLTNQVEILTDSLEEMQKELKRQSETIRAIELDRLLNSD